ncbi:hypothetical protein CSR02_09665 [Acetobacter pomorum]|uniref:Uncharacterized protein n=1 Tax=Acetobacter pomorum TaxID=65959 RepID=A0A2G4RB15_9PROT|nr:hypothetical protein CSR02_09665 [Acetobacter pomorum]
MSGPEGKIARHFLPDHRVYTRCRTPPASTTTDHTDLPRRTGTKAKRLFNPTLIDTPSFLLVWEGIGHF